MKINSKFFTSSALTLAMVVSTAAPVYAVNAHAQVTVDYVAMGDSLAAGLLASNPPGTNPNLDEGYTDIIDDWLHGNDIGELGLRGGFYEGYSVIGSTSDDLLAATSQKGEEFSQMVRAEIITITTGANDVFDPFYDLYNSYLAGTLTQPLEVALAAAIQQSTTNIETSGLTNKLEMIVNNILSVNHDAKIYIMGYYNPLPILDSMGIYGMTNSVLLLNSKIFNAVSNIGLSNVVYVETLGSVNGTYSEIPFTGIYVLDNPMSAYGYPTSFDNLPYSLYAGGSLYLDWSIPTLPMTDIHLTEIGYQVVAGEFADAIAAGLN